MEYQNHDEKAYNLHMIKTDKFKTITVKVTFRHQIVKEEITIRSFIHNILLLSNKEFPSSRLLSKEMERLYGPFIGSDENRVGNYSLTSFHMTMINEKYTEVGNNNQCMNFFKEIIFNPNVSNNSFDTKSFNIVKNEIKARLRSIKDDPRHYSMVRMLEYMDPKSPISYRSGYLKDIDAIDEKRLYEYYKNMLNNNVVDVYVLGDIDFNDMRSLIRNMIPINTVKKRQKESIYINHDKLPKRIKKCEDIEELSQAKIVIGCRIDKLTPFEYKYVLPVYSGVLGGPSYSKLFQSVREKNSLAYYIFTNYNRGSNILTVSSGINKESYNKTLKLIRAEFENMAKGNIDEDELKRAKEDLLSIIMSIEDNPLRLVSNQMWCTLYNLDELEKRKKEIFNVTVDDIKKISKKIYMDTVYLLHGGDDIETDRN